MVDSKKLNKDRITQIKLLRESTQRFVRISKEKKMRYGADLSLKDGMIADLRNEIVDMKQHLDKMQKKLSESEQAKGKNGANIQMLTYQNEELNQSLEEMDGKFRVTLSTNGVNLTNMKKDHRSQIEKLNRKLDKQQTESELLIADWKKFERINATLQDEVKGLNEKLQANERSMRQSNDTMLGKDERIEAIDKKLSVKLNENEQMMKEIRSNETVIKELQSVLKDKDLDFERLKSEIVELKQLNKDKMGQIRAMRESTQSFIDINRERKVKFRRESVMKDGMIKGLQNEMIDIKQHADKLQAELRESEQVKGKNDANIQMLQLRNEELLKQMDGKDIRLDELNQSLVSVNEESKELRETLSMSETVNKDLNDSLDSMKDYRMSQIKELEKELDDKMSDNQQFVAELRSNQAVIKESKRESINLQENLKALQVRLENETKQRETNDSVIQKLQNEVDAKDADFRKSRVENKKLLKQLDGNENVRHVTENELSMIRNSMSVRQEKYDEDMSELKTHSQGQIEMIDELNADNKVFRETLTVNQSVIADLKNMMLDKNKSMDAMKDYHLSQIDEYDQKWNQKQIEKEKLMEELRSHVAIIKKLQTAVKTKDLDLKQKQIQNEQLCARMSQSEAQITGTEERLSSIHLSFSSNEQKFKENIAELQTLNESQSEMIGELNEKIRQNDEIIGQFESSKSTIENLKQQINQKDDARQQSESQLRAVRSSMSMLKQKYEEEIRALSHDQFELIDDLNDKIKKEQDAFDELRRETTKNLNALERSNDILLRQNEEYKDKLNEFNAIQDINGMLEKKMNETHADLSESKAENQTVCDKSL